MRCYPCANWAPTDPVTSGCTSRVRRHESVWKHPLRTSACPGVSVGAGPPRECSCAYGTTARHRCPSAEDPPVSGRVPVPVTAPAPPHEQHPPARNHGVGATGPASPSVRASRPPSLLAPRPCWRSSNSTPGAQGWNPTTRNTGARTLRILLAWVGAEALFPEADIRTLADRRSTAIRRVLQFLTRKKDLSGRAAAPAEPARWPAGDGSGGQAAWVLAAWPGSGCGSGGRQRVTSKPRAPSLLMWWAICRRVLAWRS